MSPSGSFWTPREGSTESTGMSHKEWNFHMIDWIFCWLIPHLETFQLLKLLDIVIEYIPWTDSLWPLHFLFSAHVEPTFRHLASQIIVTDCPPISLIITLTQISLEFHSLFPGQSFIIIGQFPNEQLFGSFGLLLVLLPTNFDDNFLVRFGYVVLFLLSQKVLQWSEALARRNPSVSSASFTLFPLSDESRELCGDRLKNIS